MGGLIHKPLRALMQNTPVRCAITCVKNRYVCVCLKYHCQMINQKTINYLASLLAFAVCTVFVTLEVIDLARSRGASEAYPTNN